MGLIQSHAAANKSNKNCKFSGQIHTHEMWPRVMNDYIALVFNKSIHSYKFQNKAVSF